MPDTSPILALPLLQPAQAQKHVTVNEALLLLEAAVQLVVEGSQPHRAPRRAGAGPAPSGGVGGGGRLGRAGGRGGGVRQRAVAFRAARPRLVGRGAR